MNSTRRLLTTALVTAAAALAVGVAPAAADLSIERLEGEVSNNGHFSREAGAHSDLTTVFALSSKEFGPKQIGPTEDPRDVRVSLPLGLVGNPTAVPTCSAALLVAGQGSGSPHCPIESQVGVTIIDNGRLVETRPVFNMEHGDEIPGLFALNYAGVIVRFQPEVRPGDYGIDTVVKSIAQSIPLVRVGLLLWDAPADRSHDSERFDVSKNGEEFPGYGASSKAPNLPFMTNPTSCPAAPTVTFGEANSWQNPNVNVHASFDSDPAGIPFIWRGCNRVPFKPAITVQSGTHRAAATSGLDIRIKVPQVQDPHGIASAHVRKVVTELPNGMTVSPSAVAGLGACSEAQIGLGTNDPPTCPDSSKLGNVTIASALLEKPLEGEVTLARQNENPFGSTFAIYLTAKGPGFCLKLPGELNVDKQTGELEDGLRPTCRSCPSTKSTSTSAAARRPRWSPPTPAAPTRPAPS